MGTNLYQKAKNKKLVLDGLKRKDKYQTHANHKIHKYHNTTHLILNHIKILSK